VFSIVFPLLSAYSRGCKYDYVILHFPDIYIYCCFGFTQECVEITHDEIKAQTPQQQGHRQIINSRQKPKHAKARPQMAQARTQKGQKPLDPKEPGPRRSRGGGGGRAPTRPQAAKACGTGEKRQTVRTPDSNLSARSAAVKRAQAQPNKRPTSIKNQQVTTHAKPIRNQQR
jgi:hypothetical protein